MFVFLSFCEIKDYVHKDIDFSEGSNIGAHDVQTRLHKEYDYDAQRFSQLPRAVRSSHKIQPDAIQ